MSRSDTLVIIGGVLLLPGIALLILIIGVELLANWLGEISHTQFEGVDYASKS